MSTRRDGRVIDAAAALVDGGDDVRPESVGINIHQSLARHKVNGNGSSGRHRTPVRARVIIIIIIIVI